MVRIPLEASFYPPLGSVEYKKALLLIMNELCSHLNSLAPDIVEAILAGAEPDGLSITKLTEQPIPVDWNEQRRFYCFPER